MDMNTPARDIRETDLEKNVDMLRDLLTGIEPPGRIVEYFGGLGMMTEFLAGWAPKARLVAFEQDPQCLVLAETRVMRWANRVTFLPQDCLTAGLPFVKPGVGVVLDFNVMTLLRAQREYEARLSAIFARAPAFVALTDSAVSKFHLNFESYGLAEANWAEYMKAWGKYLRPKGYKVKKFVTHTKASMFLAVPK